MFTIRTHMIPLWVGDTAVHHWDTWIFLPNGTLVFIITRHMIPLWWRHGCSPLRHTIPLWRKHWCSPLRHMIPLWRRHWCSPLRHMIPLWRRHWCSPLRHMIPHWLRHRCSSSGHTCSGDRTTLHTKTMLCFFQKHSIVFAWRVTLAVWCSSSGFLVGDPE